MVPLSAGGRQIFLIGQGSLLSLLVNLLLAVTSVHEPIQLVSSVSDGGSWSILFEVAGLYSSPKCRPVDSAVRGSFRSVQVGAVRTSGLHSLPFPHGLLQLRSRVEQIKLA
jgi:hypothetical protein